MGVGDKEYSGRQVTDILFLEGKVNISLQNVRDINVTKLC